MDLFQQQMNRKDEHVGHANQQYRATSAPEFVETRFVHHPFTTVDVLMCHCRRSLLDSPSTFHSSSTRLRVEVRSRLR